MNQDGSIHTKTYWDRLLWLEEQAEDDDPDRTNRLLFMMMEENKQVRCIKWQNKRLNWQEHIVRELHTGTFGAKYHMPLPQFNKLVNLLRDGITVDAVRSSASTCGNTPIYPELIAGMTLRFLGGEKVKSLEDIFGVDHSSVSRLIELCFTTIVESNHKELQIVLPQSTMELTDLARGFDSISSGDGLFYSCVGAIDGWLCSTIQPIDGDDVIANKRDYFSGHYQCFGLNVQAICDHRLRFIYFSVAAPGKTGDARAFNKCVKLNKWVDKFLKGSPYFFVGDNAYVLCDELLITYSGRNMTEAQRTYNYFLSQMRIRIEMAFGRLTTKWRIFRAKLENSTKKNAMICRVAAILHNFVINETTIDETVDGFIESFPGAPSEAMGYLPVHGDDEDDEGNFSATMETSGAGVSHRRQAFLHIVQRDGMTRPLHNILRNNNN